MYACALKDEEKEKCLIKLNIRYTKLGIDRQACCYKLAYFILTLIFFKHFKPNHNNFVLLFLYRLYIIIYNKQNLTELILNTITTTTTITTNTSHHHHHHNHINRIKYS